MLATQAVAEGATAVTPKTTVKPETISVPSGSQTEQINLAATTNLPLAAQDGATADVNALPDAPAAPAETSDSASLSMPPELKAMMDDAAQNSQNLQSAPATKPHGIQRPGMLVMGIVGAMGMGLGALLYASDKGTLEARAAGGSILFAPGAVMAGFGFYYAFKPKQ
jgi:hypothetical protein